MKSTKEMDRRKALKIARDGGEWRDVTASFSEILASIAEFLRRPTLR